MTVKVSKLSWSDSPVSNIHSVWIREKFVLNIFSPKWRMIQTTTSPKPDDTRKNSTAKVQIHIYWPCVDSNMFALLMLFIKCKWSIKFGKTFKHQQQQLSGSFRSYIIRYFHFFLSHFYGNRNDTHPQHYDVKMSKYHFRFDVCFYFSFLFLHQCCSSIFLLLIVGIFWSASIWSLYFFSICICCR